MTGARARFTQCTMVADESAKPPLRRALGEATEYLSELTGRPVPLVFPAAKAPGLSLSVQARQGGDAGSESFRVRVESGAGKDTIRASVMAESPLGAARGLSRLLGLIEVDGTTPSLPSRLDFQTAPWRSLRGMHLNGWTANHPYSFRVWREEEWMRYIDILFHEGVNLLLLWPFVDIMPQPLSAADESYLHEVRRVVSYAREERGMTVWIMLSANRVALGDCGVEDPRLRPYWLPDVQVDLDPGQPDQLERILRSREPLYRVVSNADAFVMIDSDPGGWKGSPVDAYIGLLRKTRELVDRCSRAGPAVKLGSWLWQGWGHVGWDPDARKPVIAEVVTLMRERLAEPWILLAGPRQFLPWLRELGVLDRTVAIPYNAIEAEPSVPFTSIEPGAVDDVLNVLADYPELAGVMGNVQCPLLQLPNVHHFARGMWEDVRREGQTGRGTAKEGADLGGLARLLHPGCAGVLSDVLRALNAVDPADIARALGQAVRLAGSRPTAGLIGRLLFPTSTQVLDDLVSQLEVRAAETELALAIDQGRPAHAMRHAVTEYFRQCLRWEQKHGFFGVVEVGRLESLFPRPPIPRSPVRTWPQFIPYPLGVGKALRSAGDPRGEQFFPAIQEDLARVFDPGKVRRGCIEAMRSMMVREG